MAGIGDHLQPMPGQSSEIQRHSKSDAQKPWANRPRGIIGLKALEEPGEDLLGQVLEIARLNAQSAEEGPDVGNFLAVNLM